MTLGAGASRLRVPASKWARASLTVELSFLDLRLPVLG